MIKKISKALLIVFFLVAGLNHFLNPTLYLPLIPDYLPYPELINIVSGLCEIMIALLYLSNATSKYAAIIAVAMLAAFILSHIHFIMIGSCLATSLCVPNWLAWFRLIVIHPLLILWTWWHR